MLSFAFLAMAILYKGRLINLVKVIDNFERKRVSSIIFQLISPKTLSLAKDFVTSGPVVNNYRLALIS